MRGRSFLARLAYGLGIAVVASMVATMIVHIPGSPTLKLLLAFLTLALITTPRLRLSGLLAVNFLLLWAFVASSLSGPAGLSIPLVRMQVIRGGQALVFVPVLLAFLRATGRGDMYLRDLSRVLVVIGTVAACAGLLKLALWGRSSGVAVTGRLGLGTALSTDYNVFATGVLCCVACALWLRSRPDEKALTRILASACLLLGSAAILMSASRRGVIFLVALFAYEILLKHKRRRSFRRAVGAIPVGVGALLVALFLAGSLFGYDNPVYAFANDRLDLTDVLSRQRTFDDPTRVMESRGPMFRYAWHRFTEESTPSQVLFGGGFSYLPAMGVEFGNRGGYDYPHNFVLSSLLYGGVIQTTATLFLVVMSWVFYVRSRAETGPLTPILLMLTLFALSSSDSIFYHELLYVLIVISAFSRPFAAGGDCARSCSPTHAHLRAGTDGSVAASLVRSQSQALGRRS